MKRKIYTSVTAFFAVILCILFGRLLTIYTQPMEDVSIDLSLMMEDVMEPSSLEDFDTKGWTVYTLEDDVRTELEPDGFGGFLGIEPGQTFYFSRVLSEKLDTPTIQLSPVNRMFSVWLGNDLIYTDCPELDNTIGQLTLPMNDWDRLDNITISLPLNYQGKTLTIAQSFPEYNEAGSLRAYPADITLYCGYAYESELIAESFSTAIKACLLFTIGVLLLFAMLWNLDLRLLLLAMVSFLWMSLNLSDTSFFYTYYGTTKNFFLAQAQTLAIGFSILFLALHAGKFRKIQVGITITYILAVFLSIAIQYDRLFIDDYGVLIKFLSFHLPEWLGLLALVTLFAGTYTYWYKENSFYHTFCILGTIFTIGYWVILIFSNPDKYLALIQSSASSLNPALFFIHSSRPVTAAAILTAIIDTVRMEVNRRLEKHLLDERRELALSNYENLRRQNEEILMIRHDMMKHFHILNDLSKEPKVNSYLEEIIGQNQQVRQIVQTGNQMMDIILNSKLSTATDAGIRLELVRASAPAKLPISDADLCSLMMNIMDNAISAASNASTESPFIQLDIHEKNDYLTITCCNSANAKSKKKERKKETVPKHGLGLKIIAGIVNRYHGLCESKFEKDIYKVQIAIPLS